MPAMSTPTTLQSALGSPQQWAARALPYVARLPRILVWLLAIALARLAAELIWAVVPVPPSPPAPAVNGPGSSAHNDAADLTTIAAAHLFGAYEPPKNPDAAAVQAAPDTQLNLTLLGILAGDERDSRALIAAQVGDEAPYAIGDTITAGVKLQAIFPDRVVLARLGRLETLRLDKDRPRNGFGGEDAVALSSDDEETGDGPEDETSNAPLVELRNQLLSDPSRAAQFIRVQPVNPGGQLQGYRVYPGPDRTLFQNSGLRPGDVITAVNGVQLNDPAHAVELVGELVRSNEVTLVVDRGGTSQTIQVDFNPN